MRAASSRQGLAVEPGGRDHDALLLERARIGGHAARFPGPHVRVVGAAGREADRLALMEERRDDRDVGQVGAALVGVVEDPADPGLVPLVENGRYRRRHRAEMDGDVLGLHRHPPALVEQRRGGIAALLDVRRVRGADQHGAHLVAGRAQRAEHHLERDRVEPAHRSSTTPSASARACQPGGTTSVEPGSSKIAGPSTSAVPGPRMRAAAVSSPKRTARDHAPLPARRAPREPRHPAGRPQLARSRARARRRRQRGRSALRARDRTRPAARRAPARATPRRRARTPGLRSAGRRWRAARSSGV